MKVKSIPSNATPPDSTWKQRLFESKKLSLVLRDHSNGIYAPQDKLDSAKVARPDFKNHAALATSTEVGKEVRVVAHLSAAETRESAQGDLFEPNGGVGGCDSIILQVSTQPVSSSSASSGNFVWFSMRDLQAYEKLGEWLPEFLKLTFEQAKRIARFQTRAEAHEFEADFSHFLDIILPGRVESCLAFRLLCEATKAIDEANAEREKSGQQATKSAELSGITIHAPTELKDWLAPFGKESGDATATAIVIDNVAGLIGSGDIKTRAKAVLDAVSGNGETLKNAIEAFLNPEANPPAQP